MPRSLRAACFRRVRLEPTIPIVLLLVAVAYAVADPSKRRGLLNLPYETLMNLVTVLLARELPSITEMLSVRFPAVALAWNVSDRNSD